MQMQMQMQMQMEEEGVRGGWSWGRVILKSASALSRASPLPQ